MSAPSRQGPTQAHNFLQSLNPAQLQAVQHDPNIPLQILAGPGSGKTKVLTSRIAHLIIHHLLPPSSICAVTFTKKTANEMRERLTKLIGKERTSQVRMGTFHALCALYLRKHALHVGIKGNFTICDTEEGKKIISSLLKERKDYMVSNDIEIQPGNLQSKISKFKARGLSAEDVLTMTPAVHPNEHNTVLVLDRLIAELYSGYQGKLKKNNSLDFDDLLVVGLKLFSGHRKAVSWCRHILVDEFQDTNFTQYELMRAIGVARRVTIVGDPDQSIYGWRAAEVANLEKMQRHFPGTEQIFLEQNYRSTGSILKLSLAIVSQDKNRIPKTLLSSHPSGITPVLRQCNNESHEASFIAMEIKRVMAHMGGALRWGDFAVLLRFNALSRAIESALQKEGIPHRILGGHRFFERLEIKDILAYLQLVDNSSFGPAFTRAVNVPSRGIGEKTLGELFTGADAMVITPLELVERICDAKVPDIKPAVKRKLSPFVAAIRCLREETNKGVLPSALIRKLLKLIDYQEHLHKTQPEWETRWENVQELITFASDVQGSMLTDVHLPPGEEAEYTPLRLFLQASMLSSEGDEQNEEGNLNKVSISTCHAAKGLEWPVVIIPAAEEGTFPFHRSEDIAEERRLLYVACTRAKGLLYLLNVAERKIAGNLMERSLSYFVSHVIKEDETVLTLDDLCTFPKGERTTLCQVLERPEPPEEEVRMRVEGFYESARNRRPFGHEFDAEAASITRAMQQHSFGPARHEIEAKFIPVSQIDVKPDIKPTVHPLRPFSSGVSVGPDVKPRIKQDPDIMSAAFLHRPKPLSNSNVEIKPYIVSISDVKTSGSRLDATRPLAVASSSRDVKSSQARTSKRSSRSYSLSHKAKLDPDILDLSLSSPPPPLKAKQPIKPKPMIIDLTEPAPKRVNPRTTIKREVATPSVVKIEGAEAGTAVEREPSMIILDPPTSIRHKGPSKVTVEPGRLPVAPAPKESSPGTPQTPSLNPGVKRRLGMGRIVGGYANKKFKLPT
ncbi:UvrD-helicase-domain-containing protein [Guyanagaster necrorhizus]|uniref:DNA 3'-5' helicase n=1 Tax=Guyanagaster necrorhizus TaxID=856835 RepID=A0A9P7W3A6_9AGAR|nr:UvrD-helicase-domain-containing protein [Guyanagaster necrorhizus MCA 3950]KAG7451185.1 UvrD-helicase-domain-containing protein [Guyanagaster necrorhizus MCA 3950]